MDGMDDDDLASALLDWVRQFPLRSQPETLLDLADGVALFEIMNDIDPALFNMSTVKADARDNWVLKEANLKKLLKNLARWYEKQSGFELESSALMVPPSEVAQHPTVKLVARLVQVVMGCAVMCANNETYIQRITELSEQTQFILAAVMKEVMDLTQAAARARTYSSGSQEQQPDFSAELQQLAAEKEQLLTEKTKLAADLKSLARNNEELLLENDDLKGKLQEAQQREELLARKDQTSRQDVVLRVELDSLRAELFKADSKRQEAEQLAEKQAVTISDLMKKNESLAKQADEATRLRDQLDEMKHMTDRLAKSEAIIEKLKQKAEEATELRKQVKQLQQEKEETLSKQNQLEDAYVKTASKQSAVEAYKEQVAALSSKNQELVASQTKAEFELNKLREQVSGLEAERTQSLQKVHALETRLHEAELMGATGAGGAGGDASGFAAELGQATIVNELKMSISRLERENRSLRQSAGGSDKEVLLNSMLDDEKKAREALEQKYKEELEKSLHLNDSVEKLQAQLQQLETKSMTFRAADDAAVLTQLAERDRELKTARAKLLEQERELADLQRTLSATKDALDGLTKESLTLKAELALVGKDQQQMMEELKKQYDARMHEQIKSVVAQKEACEAELATLEKKHQAMTAELNVLQAANNDLNLQVQTHVRTESTLRTQINEMQVKYAEVLEKGLPMNAAEHPEILKEKLKLATEKIEEQQASLKELQVSIKKLKDALQKETQKVSSDDASQRVADAEARLKEMREGFQQLFETAKTEQRLMATAWYNLSIQAQRTKVAGAGTRSATWLSRKRAEADKATPARPGLSAS